MPKKLFSCLMIIGLCCATTVLAQEQKSSALSDWLKAIQKKIEKILHRKEIATSTGVAGVRGARQDSQVKLYWKGRKGETVVTEEELGKFKSSVELAGKGDRDGAAKGLEEFMKQYPDSALIPDAKKTLDLVKAEPPAEVKEEKKVPEQEMKKEDQKKTDRKEDKQEGKKKETKKVE
ncbi:MAG: hypothetical protein M0Z89_04075 [Nitrospiraceae bacterium]|nr:hypothetical protein [Nitrospiraceae bacterium]